MTEAGKRTRILIVDDHAIMREGLRALLTAEPDMEVVGEASDGLGVADMVGQVRPDVVLLDIAMPGLDGLEVCRQITSRYENVAVLMVTMHQGDHYIRQAMEAGARGYLTKDKASEQLLEAIRTVARNRVWLEDPGDLLTRLHASTGRVRDVLSDREMQVFQMVAEGMSSKEIASRLGLSAKTVEVHRYHLMEKLRVGSISQLVKLAIREGVVPLD